MSWYITNFFDFEFSHAQRWYTTIGYMWRNDFGMTSYGGLSIGCQTSNAIGAFLLLHNPGLIMAGVLATYIHTNKWN